MVLPSGSKAALRRSPRRVFSPRTDGAGRANLWPPSLAQEVTTSLERAKFTPSDASHGGNWIERRG
eukprot:5962893-Pyramimonas_sp.AAC.1